MLTYAIIADSHVIKQLTPPGLYPYTDAGCTQFAVLCSLLCKHTHTYREASMDKLRAALADKVVREERQAARDKQVRCCCCSGVIRAKGS